ncbi:MAG: hypothetical protein K9K32_00820, partial [Halanaerobiales bacterium]|nr:hypothetical protein [Halanaerobiales bacterium]
MKLKYRPIYEIYSDNIFKNVIIWLGIGVTIFLSTELLIYIYGDKNYIISMALMIIGIYLWPIYYIRKLNEFFQLFFDQNIMLDHVFLFEMQKVEKVYKKYAKSIFSMKSKSMYGFIIIVLPNY